MYSVPVTNQFIPTMITTRVADHFFKFKSTTLCGLKVIMFAHSYLIVSLSPSHLQVSIIPVVFSSYDNFYNKKERRFNEGELVWVFFFFLHFDPFDLVFLLLCLSSLSVCLFLSVSLSFSLGLSLTHSLYLCLVCQIFPLVDGCYFLSISRLVLPIVSLFSNQLWQIANYCEVCL